MNLEIFIDYCDPDFFFFLFPFKKKTNKLFLNNTGVSVPRLSCLL